MTLNDYFDHIYCINMDKRLDRWNECLVQFKKHGLSVERFSAVDGSNLISQTPSLSSGELGLLFTHINLINDAKAKGYQNILILEDDVEFVDNLNAAFSYVIDYIPDDWELLYLGGNHVGDITPVNKCICKIIHTYAAHCFAMKSSVFDFSVYGLPRYKKPVDVFYAQVQKQVPSYVVRPHLAWQRQSYSDIQERVVDYFFLKK